MPPVTFLPENRPSPPYKGQNAPPCGEDPGTPLFLRHRDKIAIYVPVSGPAPVRKFQKIHKKIKFLKGKCKFWLENSKNRLEKSNIARSVRKMLNFRPIFRLENFDYLVVPPPVGGGGHLPPVRLVGMPPVAKNLESPCICSGFNLR